MLHWPRLHWSMAHWQNWSICARRIERRVRWWIIQTEQTTGGSTIESSRDTSRSAKKKYRPKTKLNSATAAGRQREQKLSSCDSRTSAAASATATAQRRQMWCAKSRMLKHDQTISFLHKKKIFNHSEGTLFLLWLRLSLFPALIPSSPYTFSISTSLYTTTTTNTTITTFIPTYTCLDFKALF